MCGDPLRNRSPQLLDTLLALARIRLDTVHAESPHVFDFPSEFGSTSEVVVCSSMAIGAFEFS